MQDIWLINHITAFQIDKILCSHQPSLENDDLTSFAFREITHSKILLSKVCVIKVSEKWLYFVRVLCIPKLLSVRLPQVIVLGPLSTPP